MGGGHKHPDEKSVYDVKHIYSFPEWGRNANDFGAMSFLKKVYNMMEFPVVWFKHNVADRFKNPPVYYQRNIRRVPTIDECYTDDFICYLEANEQFNRDWKIDSDVLIVLKQRARDCYYYTHHEDAQLCYKYDHDHDVAHDNYYTKYGDLNFNANVIQAFMKQKHRIIWERRHGAVGSGKKPTPKEWLSLKKDKEEEDS